MKNSFAIGNIKPRWLMPGWRLYLQYLKAKGEQQGEEFVAIYNAFERRIALNSSAFIND